MQAILLVYPRGWCSAAHDVGLRVVPFATQLPSRPLGPECGVLPSRSLPAIMTGLDQQTYRRLSFCVSSVQVTGSLYGFGIRPNITDPALRCIVVPPRGLRLSFQLVLVATS